MMKTTESRGRRFALVSSLVCAGLYFAVRRELAYEESFFNSAFVPGLGTAAALLALFLGHLSYPRVQNLKVYLAGLLYGFNALAYFLLVHYAPFILPFIPRPAVSFVPFLYWNAAVSGLLLLAVPSFTKFRTTKLVSTGLFVLELAAVLALRLHPLELPQVVFPLGGGRLDVVPYLPAVVLAAAAVLSLTFLKRDVFLGGVFAGSSIILGFGSVLRELYFPAYQVDRLVFAALPLFLEAGIVFHWIVRMEHRALYDPLLHIYNRTYCSQIISEQSPLNTRPPFTVAMIDIDRFKRVNDTWGHQCGDSVLFSVAQAVQQEVVPAGTVCRYGGEELAVFFPRKTLREVQPVLEKVRSAVEKAPVPWEKKHIPVTVSIGASCRERPSQSIEDVIKAADKALYAAKDAGRNRVKTAKTGQAAASRK